MVQSSKPIFTAIEVFRCEGAWSPSNLVEILPRELVSFMNRNE
jgi:hypothetical protein